LYYSSRDHPNCLLQDDIAKFVSDPASPPRLVNISKEGKAKAKEHHEVSEGDDTITNEDMSDEEDGKTLQERSTIRATTTRRGCPVMKSMMKTLSRDWVGFSRICHHAHPTQSTSTPWLVRQTRLVIELCLRVLIVL
jgi:hypothetical protein